MCRLLCVAGAGGFEAAAHLERFARISRDSREYQGHGWGCAWLEAGEWRLYRCIEPVWEDRERLAGVRTPLLVAHARSAFRDEGIRLENNMPFFDGRQVFAFNGELRGVRMRVPGRIGAEKVFNLIRRLQRTGGARAGLERALAVLERRTRYLRAANLVVAARERVLVASRFGEDPGYFQLHRARRDDLELVCSAPYPGERDWYPVPNGTVFELGRSAR